MQRLKHPLFWLAFQAGCLLVLFGLTGRLVPQAVDDTASYVDFPLNSTAALNQIRTIGYPVFLRVAGLFADDHQAVPLLQLLTHFAAVGLFYAGIRLLFGSRWTSFAIASSLLYSNLIVRYVAVLGTDAASCSFAIMSVGLLLLVLQYPTNGWCWFGLVAAEFASYQIRPAYLFLVPLIPLLGMVVLWLRTPADARRLRRRVTTGLAVASAAPLLCFCLLRLTVVGHFGLVSFGGYNLIGVTGQFLTADMVGELPDDVRSLADSGLQRRETVIGLGPDGSVGGYGFDYFAVETAYDRVVWSVYVPAAHELYQDDPKRVNSQLKRLAWAIVRARPGLYVAWVAKAFRQGIRMIVTEFILNPFNLLVVCGLMAVEAWSTIRLLPLNDRTTGVVATGTVEWFIPLRILAALALSFALFKLLLVMLVTPPIGRYMDAAGVLLPPLVVAILCSRMAAMFSRQP